ncbi:hypothetical protein [Brevundimonas sp.]|uniref:ImuA family protein n=1 Tax=Brevundimonas sp. TaxID=1871086 RepID=UPI0025C1CE56|nr:hypothetical protein [Brevundimonas sp.]
MPPPHALHPLRQQIATLQPDRTKPERTFRLGLESVDQHLGPLRADALHEVLAAAPRQGVAAQGFALGLALRATSRAVIWVLQSAGRSELGEPYGPGLIPWGLDPAHLIFVRAPDAAALLAAGEEALRSGAAGAVILSGWGEARAYGLTASRRLMMAAQAGSSLGVLVRAGASVAPSAAETRWSIAAAPSAPLEADAPGRPAFRARLLRCRSGAPPGEWTLEWDRETRAFIPASAPGGVVSVPADRPAAADAIRRTRAA